MDPIKEIRRRIAIAGSQRKFAREIGISDAYLCDLLKGNRSPSDRILHAIGMEKVIEYRRREGAAYPQEGVE